MPIDLLCQGCGERLRVADEHAGKQARCPKCQSLTSVAAAPPTFAEPSAPVAEQWSLRLEDGRTFGPIDRGRLDQWYAEGRITPRSHVRSSDGGPWREAGEVYPGLAVGAPAPIPHPFGDRDANPYASPLGLGPARSAYQKPHRGALVLVFGLLGMLFCFLFAPLAVIMGHSDLNDMKRGAMDPEGQGLTIGGVVLGWIVTVPLILGAGLFAILLVIGIVAG